MAKTRLGRFVGVAYDYGRLDKQLAAYARSVAERCRPNGKRTLAEVVVEGNDLWTLKKRMGYGEFDQWRRAEFRSREGTAENAMAVAKWLGRKSQKFWDLRISVSACHLLVRRWVPDAVRQGALDRAFGEEITLKVAEALVAPYRRRHAEFVDKLGRRIKNMLNDHKEQWFPNGLSLIEKDIQNYFDSLRSELNHAPSHMFHKDTLPQKAVHLTVAGS